MACDPIHPAACAAGSVAKAVTNSAVQAFADALKEGAQWVIKTTAAWWLNVPSIDLANSPATKIRGFVLPVSMVVAAGGIIWGGTRIVLRRKAEPAWDIGTGMLRLVAVSAMAITLPQLLLDFGDSFSKWVMDQAVRGDAADHMTKIAAMGGITAPGAVIFAAIIMILSGAVQAILMFLREGAIIILAGVLILAAAGGFNPLTKNWFPKVSGWLAALVLYKPIAALVYAAAFAMIGDKNDDPRTVFVGLTMLMLSIVALPTMMKFFSWVAPGAVSAGSGGGLALAGMGMTAMAMRGVASGGSASDQAARIERDLGSGGGGGSGGGPSGASGGGSGSSGAAESAGMFGGAGGSAGGGAGASGSSAASSSSSGSSSAAAGAAAAVPAAAVILGAAKAAEAVKEGAAKAMTGGQE